MPSELSCIHVLNAVMSGQILMVESAEQSTMLGFASKTYLPEFRSHTAMVPAEASDRKLDLIIDQLIAVARFG